MGDEVWVALTDIKQIFGSPDIDHLVVARYHGKMVADSVRVVDWEEEVIKDSRSRMWRLTEIHEGELHKFVRVMARTAKITVYEEF